MLTPRRIPVLQILNGKLVKTENFKNPNYIGDPLNAVKIFNDKEVDELIICDITPGLFKTGPDFQLIETLLSECQMPVGYGGGIRGIADAHQIFHSGAEKVIINTLAFDSPQAVFEISKTYGSQAVSLSIDYSLSFFRKWNFHKKNGQKKTNLSIDGIVALCREIGCGEIILHSIDSDGKLQGLDYDLLYKIKDKISVPIVLLGGAKNEEDFQAAITHGAHSVAAGSMFIYQGPHKAVLIQY
jgi:cyclase